MGRILVFTLALLGGLLIWSPAHAEEKETELQEVPKKVLYVLPNQPVYLVDGQGKVLQALYLRPQPTPSTKR